MGKKLQKCPRDSDLSKAFHFKKKIYKRYVKNCKKAFKQDISDKLNDMEDRNPKAYWNLVEKLKTFDCEKVNSDSAIDEQSWFNYFKELLSINNNNDNTLDEKIEKLQTFTELDYSVKLEEVQKQIKK